MVATSFSAAAHLLVAKTAAENLPPVRPSLGSADHGRVPDHRHSPWVDSASLTPGQGADVRDGGAVWVGEGPPVALLDRPRWVAPRRPSTARAFCVDRPVVEPDWGSRPKQATCAFRC